MMVTMASTCRPRRAAAAPAPSPGTRPETRARPVLFWTGVALFALAADAATKAWAQSALHPGHQITLAGGLIRLRLIANHGAAFGFGAGYEPLVVLASAVGVVLLGLWVRYATSTVERLGAALAVGGGLGNLADRLLRPPVGWHGAVVDWIHVSFYAPTFNLADVWLRGGILIAALAWLWNRRNRPAPRRTAPPD
jgi:signal peptidase II